MNVAMAGMNPWMWLNESDSFKRNIMTRVADRHGQIRSLERLDLAGRVIELLGKAMK